MYVAQAATRADPELECKRRTIVSVAVPPVTARPYHDHESGKILAARSGSTVRHFTSH